MEEVGNYNAYSYVEIPKRIYIVIFYQHIIVITILYKNYICAEYFFFLIYQQFQHYNIYGLIRSIEFYFYKSILCKSDFK